MRPNNERYRPVLFAEAVRHFENDERLKMQSGELKGPCPDCGGEDRFRINEKPNGEAGFHCRQCGGPSIETIHAMRDEVRGNGIVHFPAPAKRPATPATTTRDAQKVWNRAQAIPPDPEHPANRWAQEWGFPGLRWPYSIGYRAGYLYARYDSRSGEGVATEKIALHGRMKKTYGPRRGAVCIVSDPDRAQTVWLCEGVKDALGLSHLLRAADIPARVAALGGTSNANPDAALFAAGGRRVIIAFDNDSAGAQAARRLGMALPDEPRPIWRRPPRGIHDWADFTKHPGDIENKTAFMRHA